MYSTVLVRGGGFATGLLLFTWSPQHIPFQLSTKILRSISSIHFHPDMYLSSILVAFAAAALSPAAPTPLQDSTSRSAHQLSRVEIQHFLQARNQFTFDNNNRKGDDNQDLPQLYHVRTRHAKRDVADCSTYPPELQVFCFSVYSDGEDDYFDTPLKSDEVIGISSFESSQTGWTAWRSIGSFNPQSKYQAYLGFGFGWGRLRSEYVRLDMIIRYPVIERTGQDISQRSHLVRDLSS